MTEASSTTALAMIEAKSIHGLCVAVAQSKTRNLVRFPGDYKAENAGNAKSKAALGESGRGKGQGVGHTVSPKLTGLAYDQKGGKLTVILNVLDMTHRQDAKRGDFAEVGEREYEYAARTVADITDPSRTLPWIEVCDDFHPWKRIALSHLPVFPVPSDETAFATALLAVRRLGVKVHKLNAKVSGIKDKLRKNKLTRAEAVDGSVAVYEPPTGTVAQLQDADGNPIKGLPRTVSNRGQLYADSSQDDADYFPAEWIQTEGRFAGRLKSDVEMLPVYMAALEDARAEYETRNAEVRHFECGIIERELKNGVENGQSVEVGGIVFELQVNDDTEYDHAPDVAEKIASGEYREVQVAKSRGAWTLIRAKQPAATS